MMALLGGAATLAGAFLLYLGAPHQRLLARTRRAPGLLWAGGLFVLIALLLLLGFAGPATAVFVWMTLVMAMWSIVPLVVAWRRRPRDAA